MLFLSGYQFATLQNPDYIPTCLQLPRVRADLMQPLIERLQVAIIGIERDGRNEIGPL